MFEATAVLALLGTVAINDEETIYCDFHGNEAIHLTLKPTPSLWDQPENFRLHLTMNDRTVVANAAPIADTAERDVMIRPTGTRDRMLAIGLRDDGRAALNIRSRDAEPQTVMGDCRGNLGYLDRWLPGPE